MQPPKPRPASVDGILHRPQGNDRVPDRPVQTIPVAQPAPPSPAAPSKPRRVRRILKTFLQAGALMAVLLIGLLSRYAVIGQIMIGVYAVAVLIFRVESRTTFTLAFMSLAVVLIASLRADRMLASAFAIYAFLLLALGVVALSREIHDTL